MKQWIIAFVAVAAVVTMVPVSAHGQAIAFTDLQDAMRTGMRERKTVAVFFSAPWCTWCKKMKTDSFTDAAVQNLARQMVWAEVNVEQEPVVAAIFGAEGVPVLTFLNAEGELLGARGGYVAPGELATLLRKRAGEAQSPGERRQRVQGLLANAQKLATMSDPKELNDAVRGLVELAAEPHRELRQPVAAALRSPRTWPQLVTALDDSRLAIRAAAYDLLRDVTGQDLAFDPFATDAVRKPQSAAWAAWVASQSGKELAVEAPAPATPPPTTQETR